MQFIVTILVVLLIVVASCIKVVPQAHSYVIERIGTYKTTWSAGLHFLVPFVRISDIIIAIRKEIVKEE